MDHQRGFFLSEARAGRHDLNPNSGMKPPFLVAQVSEPAVSPTSLSAGLRRFGAAGMVPALAGWETRDTAGWEACATTAWPSAPIPFSEIGLNCVAKTR